MFHFSFKQHVQLYSDCYCINLARAVFSLFEVQSRKKGETIRGLSITDEVGFELWTNGDISRILFFRGPSLVQSKNG